MEHEEIKNVVIKQEPSLFSEIFGEGFTENEFIKYNIDKGKFKLITEDLLYKLSKLEKLINWDIRIGTYPRASGIKFLEEEVMILCRYLYINRCIELKEDYLIARYLRCKDVNVSDAEIIWNVNYEDFVLDEFKDLCLKYGVDID